MSSKYDQAAERFTEVEYAEPGRYFSHRADILVSLGPRLVPGDRVLDLACADASFAEPLIAHGLAYTGVDVSEPMVDVARRRLGDRAELIAGDAIAYVPPEPVAATTIFRSLHVVGDRVAFFRHVASFTEKKLVFDVAPRLEPLDRLRSQLRDGGWDRVETRPFFVPQNVRLPRPVGAALTLAERLPLLAALLLRRRFAVLVAAYRSGR
jgi:SAM-dependent methyltransferase